MKIKGVSIGDKFINSMHRKNKIISTVVDFVEKRSFLTGEILGYDIVSEHIFLGQKMKGTAAFSTVLMNKIK